MFSLQPSLFEVSLPGFPRYWSSTTGSVLCTLGEGEEGGVGDRTASLSASHEVTSVTTLWAAESGGKSRKDVSWCVRGSNVFLRASHQVTGAMGS